MSMKFTFKKVQIFIIFLHMSMTDMTYTFKKFQIFIHYSPMLASLQYIFTFQKVQTIHARLLHIVL